jgi:translation initiation factor IF-3
MQGLSVRLNASVQSNGVLVAWCFRELFRILTDGLSNRPNQGGPISTETRVNERIRVPEVRLIGPAGEQVGIVRIEDALRVAADADLDLVEVAPEAKPPVCKIMDYGKFKYETAQKLRESRKNQQQTVVKEQKLRPKIDPHDYETKKGHVIRFLEAGSKVKVTIMFRGREQSRPELGYRLLQRLGADVADHGFIETSAKQDGRNMTMVLAPHRGAKTRAKAATQVVGAPAAEPVEDVATDATATDETATEQTTA